MKSVLIVYNQANNERVEYMLDTLGIRGFTQWENVQGRGNVQGDPHRGTHTWPELNNAILTIVPDVIPEYTGSGIDRRLHATFQELESELGELRL